MADRIVNRASRWGRAVSCCLVLATCTLWRSSIPLSATELTGIVIYTCATTNDPDQCDPAPAGLAWHTAAGEKGAPIGVLPLLLPANALAPLVNPFVDLRYPLRPGKALFTLLWQPEPLHFPPRLGVNLFFNGNTVQPGITAIVPAWQGPALTNFHANLTPTTYSLPLRDAENPGTLTYSDGNNLVELTAFMAAPPNVVAKIDLMGPHAFGRDGNLDAVGILELTVNPIRWRQTPVRTAPTVAGLVLGPAQIRVGAALGTPSPVPAVTEATPAVNSASPTAAAALTPQPEPTGTPAQSPTPASRPRGSPRTPTTTP